MKETMNDLSDSLFEIIEHPGGDGFADGTDARDGGRGVPSPGGRAENNNNDQQDYQKLDISSFKCEHPLTFRSQHNYLHRVYSSSPDPDKLSAKCLGIISTEVGLPMEEVLLWFGDEKLRRDNVTPPRNREFPLSPESITSPATMVMTPEIVNSPGAFTHFQDILSVLSPTPTQESGPPRARRGRPPKIKSEDLPSPDSKRQKLSFEFPCLDCGKTFAAERWSEHIKRVHFPTEVWECPKNNPRSGKACIYFNPKPFFRPDNFSTHLRGEHRCEDVEINNLKETCRFEVVGFFHKVCGFCGVDLKTRDMSVDHIKGHLREISQRAFPPKDLGISEWTERCGGKHTIQRGVHYNLKGKIEKEKEEGTDDKSQDDDNPKDPENGPDLSGSGPPNDQPFNGEGDNHESHGHFDFYNGGRFDYMNFDQYATKFDNQEFGPKFTIQSAGNEDVTSPSSKKEAHKSSASPIEQSSRKNEYALPLYLSSERAMLENDPIYVSSPTSMHFDFTPEGKSNHGSEQQLFDYAFIDPSLIPPSASTKPSSVYSVPKASPEWDSSQSPLVFQGPGLAQNWPESEKDSSPLLVRTNSEAQYPTFEVPGGYFSPLSSTYSSLHAGYTRSTSSRSTDSSLGSRGVCPIPSCGKVFKDLKAHMLTHTTERPEKCPITTCDYHVKGFARKYDKNRHTLTHYKGTMVCPFCPGIGSAAEKTFNRADVFKRHLFSVHGVEPTPPNGRRTLGEGKRDINRHVSKATLESPSGKCSTCAIRFDDAQEFYDHLDDCVLRVVQQEEPSEAINAARLSHDENISEVKETLRKHRLSDATIDPLDEEEDEEEVLNSDTDYNQRDSPLPISTRTAPVFHSKGDLTSWASKKWSRRYPSAWRSPALKKKRVIAGPDSAKFNFAKKSASSASLLDPDDSGGPKLLNTGTETAPSLDDLVAIAVGHLKNGEYQS